MVKYIIYFIFPEMGICSHFLGFSGYSSVPSWSSTEGPEAGRDTSIPCNGSPGIGTAICWNLKDIKNRGPQLDQRDDGQTHVV